MKLKRIVVNDGRTTMFYLVGPVGGVSFNLEKQPMEIEHRIGREGLREMGIVLTDAGYYMGTDIGVHYRYAKEGLSEMDSCHVLHQPCWYTGSSLFAFELARQWEDAHFDEGHIKAALEGVYLAEFLDG